MTQDGTPDAGSPFAHPESGVAGPAGAVPDAGSPLVLPGVSLEAAAPATGSARSGRGGAIAGFVLAGLAILALAIFAGYLWSVHSQYVAQNEELRETATELGADLAAAEAQAAQLQADLDETTVQLDEAKAHISDLANSEAQAGDDRQALVDVAAALQDCADARQNLINHLKEASRWTPESLRANEASVTEYCNSVVDTYNEIVNE